MLDFDDQDGLPAGEDQTDGAAPAPYRPYLQNPNSAPLADDPMVDAGQVLYYLAMGAQPDDFHPAVQPMAQTFTVALFCALSALPGAASARVSAVEVPYVGCAADGQLGPQPPPKQDRATPSLPPEIAGRLAYYASVNFGVLAPHGWNCFSTYGSSGTSLFITPSPIDRAKIFEPGFRLRGEAIEFNYNLGGTSGRYVVADIGSGLFPVTKPFVKSTLELEKSVGGTWRPAFKKHPSDRITVKSPTIVRYVTPPHHDGLGTRSRLAPDALPIQGEVILIKDEGDFDMIQLDVRLLGVRTALASTIRSGAEANHGAALSDTPLQMPADN